MAWFWAPLIAKWWSPTGQPKSLKKHVATAPVMVAPASASTALAEQPDWRELARSLNNRPLPSLAALMTPARDPFYSDEAPTATQTLGKEPAREYEPESGSLATLEAMKSQLSHPGMKLDGVLLGDRFRAAIINGVVYRERESIPVEGVLPADDLMNSASRPNLPMALLMVVAVDHAIVRVGNDTMRLDLAGPKLAPGDRIVPHHTHTGR